MQNVILQLRYEITDAFAEVDKWIGCDDKLVNYIPRDGRWSIRKILEHITLTNHYLLILIKKGTDKALKVAGKKNVHVVDNYQLDWKKLESIGVPGSFYWNRPDHMDPTGELNNLQIIQRLGLQLKECLDCLDKLKNGQGTLYKIMMSVNDIGKIDVYHFMLFLAQHARRHIVQMQHVKLEFESIKN